MNLSGCLGERTPDSTLWRAGGLVFTAGPALARTRLLRSTWARAHGRRVAVWAGQQHEMLEAVLALDGFAAALLLIPADTSELQAAEFCERAAIEYIAGSREAGFIGQERHLEVPPDGAGALCDGSDEVDTEWLLTTSGTTAAPKLVAHRLAKLCATTQQDAQRGSSLVWGLLYDPARFAGLQVVLQSLLGGATLVLTDPALGVGGRLDEMAGHGVNALSATPTLWRKLLMQGGVQRLPLALATLGGEIADQKILSAVQAAFPQARVRHVYASTEAGVGFSVTDGQEGFPRAWLREAPQGIGLRIVADQHPDEGELWIRSPRASLGYHGGASLADADGWLPSGDRVRIEGERVLFLGRENGSINVGGDKVFPEEVERALCAHPAVFAAAVSGRKNPFTGALVEAVVVPGTGIEGGPALKEQLLAHCRALLPKHAVPALLRFASTLETNTAGKKERKAV